MRLLALTFVVWVILVGSSCGMRGAPSGRGGGSASTPSLLSGSPFPRGYDALSYDLDLSLVAAGADSFDGALTVTFASRRPGLAELDLDSVGLDVRAVGEGGVPRRFRIATGHLFVALDPPAPDGAVRTVSIQYHGAPSLGLRRFEDHAYTAFHTNRWMPCNFDPGEKATFRLSLTVAPDWKVLGNGEPAGISFVPGGQKHTWAMQAPHSAYLFGFVAGRLTEEVRDGAPGMPKLEVIATARTPAVAVSRVFDETPGMIRFFEDASGVPLPGRRYAVAFVAGGAAQELALLSALGDDYAQTWATTPSEDWLVVHELAHQWWGNAATCATWGDFWIQEAFAVFMTAAYKERRWGRQAYDRERDLAQSRYDKARAAGEDRPLAGAPNSPAGFLPRKLVYSKGPLVLFALRQDLGEERFWSAVRDFTRAAVGSAIRNGDLQNVFERAAGQRLPIFERAVFGAGSP